MGREFGFFGAKMGQGHENQPICESFLKIIFFKFTFFTYFVAYLPDNITRICHPQFLMPFFVQFPKTPTLLRDVPSTENYGLLKLAAHDHIFQALKFCIFLQNFPIKYHHHGVKNVAHSLSFPMPLNPSSETLSTESYGHFKKRDHFFDVRSDLRASHIKCYGFFK